MAKRIITIGRECGSGGHTIGRLIAHRLGIPFYDKEILDLVAAKTKLSPELGAARDEYFRSGRSYGYDARFSAAVKDESRDQMYLVQTELIREIAERERCVIVGCCADHILRERRDTLHVFICADTPYKIERTVRVHHTEEQETAALLLSRDQDRARHYQLHTGRTWGMAKNYHLSLDSGALGVGKCVELICAAYRNE